MAQSNWISQGAAGQCMECDWGSVKQRTIGFEAAEHAQKTGHRVAVVKEMIKVFTKDENKK